MRRTNVSCLALAVTLFLAGAGAPLAAQSRTTAAGTLQRGWKVGDGLQADPAVRFGILPNGMRYVIRRNATPPGEASLRLRIDTGSLNEREDQRGLAHFLEHMVLNGTRNVPEGEFVRRLERNGLKFGPDTNASTDFEETVYKLELPETDKETVDTALFLLREVADKALLEAKAIDSERGIILAEERTRSTPQQRQSIHEIGFLFPGQLLPERIPIGTDTVIRTAPRDRFVEFYNAFYRPENATLVAVGDFDIDAMEARIRTQFGDWKGEGQPGRIADQGQVARRGADAGLFVDPAMATRVSVSWVRPADTNPDSRARRIKDTIEGLGLAIFNRRLERIAASDKAPFVAANGGESQFADTGDVTQLIAVARPGEWREALAAIDAEQRRLVRHGVAPAELAREITQGRTALTGAVSAASTRSTRALADGLVGTLNDDNTPTTPEARLALFEEAVRGITPATVNQAVARLFSGSGPLLYMTAPAPPEGGKQALLSAYRDASRMAVAPPAAQRAQAWPYAGFGAPGQVVERRELAELGATAVRFANGVRLTVKSTDFRKDQILVQARIGDGKLDLDPTRPNPEWAIAAGGFTMGGLKRISAENMREALNGKLYSGSFGLDDDAFVLGGSTRPADFATQLQVLAAYVAEPGWGPSGWDRLRSLSGTIQDQLASTPGGVFNRDADALLRRGDPRWRTPTRGEMAASSIGDARALLAGPLTNDPVELVIVGDITADEAIRQVAATFGALPPRTGKAASRPTLAFPAGTPEPVTLTHKGREDQGLAFIAWPTLGFYADPRLVRTLNVLAAVFQLRLNDRIREKEAVSYSPVGSHASSDTFRDYGYMFGRVEAPPAALPAFLREAQAIATELRTTPVTADELQRAVKPLTERLQRERQGNGWWLSQLAGAATDPRRVEAITSQLRDYQAVTPAALKQAAERYLLPAKAYKVVVVPEKSASKN
ncbi:M16 family metallopeptidase [Sphingomonas sp. GCM10030256]|uniref:M16 family metallopeptidase n=1 Tax=Sphingomonas sp. GCM10030256 TaxID=3273427 RepID=UPI0036219C6B